MNPQLGTTLVRIRKALGYPSARAFHAWLSQRAELGINYSYYMRIESGRVQPSSSAVDTIASLLPQPHGDHLTLAWCRDAFPARAALFTGPSEAPPRTSTGKNSLTRVHQKVLTEKQVAAIAATKEHYYLFLVATLARGPVTLGELPFSQSERVVTDLEAAKVVIREAGAVRSTFPEWAFPQAASKSLQEVYRKLDAWDRERNAYFGLKKEKTAEMFRRISPRYLDLVLQNVDLLLQTVRLAEDMSPVHNDEVVGLSLEISRGRIPG